MGRPWVPCGEIKPWSGSALASSLSHKAAFQGTEPQHMHFLPRTIYKPTACKLKLQVDQRRNAGEEAAKLLGSHRRNSVAWYLMIDS